MQSNPRKLSSWKCIHFVSNSGNLTSYDLDCMGRLKKKFKKSSPRHREEILQDYFNACSAFYRYVVPTLNYPQINHNPSQPQKQKSKNEVQNQSKNNEEAKIDLKDNQIHFEIEEIDDSLFNLQDDYSSEYDENINFFNSIF